MTFNDEGLARAMKNAYKDDGYVVACTPSGYIITGDMWGVAIHDQLIPNSIKSLIVLHTGKLPEVNKAINVRKNATNSWIYEMAVDRIMTLRKIYREMQRNAIRPTRMTMDGCLLWQQPDTLAVKLTAPENQQILDYEDNDAYLVDDVIYGETLCGSVFVSCQKVKDEDMPLLAHLAQMQWIPMELE